MKPLHLDKDPAKQNQTQAVITLFLIPDRTHGTVNGKKTNKQKTFGGLKWGKVLTGERELGKEGVCCSKQDMCGSKGLGNQEEHSLGKVGEMGQAARGCRVRRGGS